ncbi:transposase, partial [Actinoplanes sp. G11-F43]|uniref:transposase n=1 Tax=Actinoplanes sp. G11-F43 TaxID=3424130 RepID=UPI003D32CA47
MRPVLDHGCLRKHHDYERVAPVLHGPGSSRRATKTPAHSPLKRLRNRPASARHTRQLTTLERATGWRYQIVATSITRIRGVSGSHQPQWLDALHRSHAGVEDQVRHGKAMGLRILPSHAWTINQGWVLTCNIAADLAAWLRLLGLHGQAGLADAEPETLRYRLLHLPAKLATHARRRVLSIPDTWPWAT